MLRNTDRSWGAPAKLLHWVVAVFVLAQICLGWAAVSWRLSPTKLDLFVWHKSIGMLILLLMLARLAWRSVNVAPSLPAGMAPFELLAARLTHVILYGLLLVMPLTGWIISSAANIPFRIFGWSPCRPSCSPTRRWPMRRRACTLRCSSCCRCCWSFTSAQRFDTTSSSATMC